MFVNNNQNLFSHTSTFYFRKLINIICSFYDPGCHLRKVSVCEKNRITIEIHLLFAIAYL